MSSSTGIPFLDLITPHVELESKLAAVFQRILNSAMFIGGPEVEQFEREFATFCDARFCVGVSSGTDALRFALMAVGIRSGDTVLTVPNTFIATGEAISQAGAVPEFVDVDERTYNLDPAKLVEYLETQCDTDAVTGRPISRRTRRPVTAVVPVHLYGQMADMDAICEIAERFRLIVVEDACQAHGAEYFSRRDGKWKKAGSIGKAAAFSFYPGKNLGACGEGGAVISNEEDTARTIKIIRDHGQAKKYYHDIEGYNGRLDAIQAGVLSVKLGQLALWNEQRCENARRYNKLLGGSEGVVTPYEPSWSKAVYHLYVVRVADRADLQRYLEAAKIGTGIHYPVPLHLQKAYEGLGYAKGDFPVAEGVSAEILSLPMYPGLMVEQQARVAERVIAYVRPEATRVLAVGAGD